MIHDLIKASWHATYINPELGITKDVIDSTFNNEVEQRQIESLRSRALRKNANDISLIAQEGGSILGFARLKISEKEAEWVSLYVHPDHIGKGMGTALWQCAAKKIPQNIPIIVEVATYTKAVGFYKKIGFRDTGEIGAVCMTDDCKITIPIMRLIRESSS